MNMTNKSNKLLFLCGEEDISSGIELLLVSSPSYLDRMKESLLTQKRDKKYPFALKVHLCNGISQILTTVGGSISFDFIVIIVDPQNPRCLDEVASNLSQIENKFSRERICILNALTSYNKMAVKPVDVFQFSRNYKFNYLVDNISDDKLELVSTRILNLLERMCGINQQIPFVEPARF